MNKALVVMAAGLGARYGGVKQIDPVGPAGEILMEYAIYDALRAGFDRLVVIVRPEMLADCEALFGARISRAAGVPVEFALQRTDGSWQGIPISPARTKPLGTVHALLSAKAFIDRPFAVINADDYYGAEALRAMAGALDTLRGAQTSAMAAYRLKNTVSPFGAVTRGVCTAEGDQLGKITETYHIRLLPDGRICADERALSPDALVSMNFWGFHPEILPVMETAFEAFLRALAPEDNAAECLLPTVMDTLISAGVTQTRLLHTDGTWLGLTYRGERPGVLEALRQKHANGEYPPALWKLPEEQEPPQTK